MDFPLVWFVPRFGSTPLRRVPIAARLKPFSRGFQGPAPESFKDLGGHADSGQKPPESAPLRSPSMGQRGWLSMVMAMVLPPALPQPSVRAMAAWPTRQVKRPSPALSGAPWARVKSLDALCTWRLQAASPWAISMERAMLCRLSCWRSEEHTSELQSLLRISYAV